MDQRVLFWRTGIKELGDPKIRTDVQVADVGGGVVGASVLYWPAKMGWTDSVLIKPRKLTSESTWQAADNTTYFGPYAAMTPLLCAGL